VITNNSCFAALTTFQAGQLLGFAVKLLDLPTKATHLFGGIPTVHQDSPELQSFLVNAVQQHLLHVIKFAFAISVWIINPIVNDPKLIHVRVDVYTSDDPDAFGDSVCIATVLAAHQLNLLRKVLVGHRSIKDQKAVWHLDSLAFDIHPGQFGWQAFSRHVAIECIVTEFLAMAGKVRQRIKVMLALSQIPVKKRTPLIKKAIQQGVDFIFGIGPATAKYPARLGDDKPNHAWWKFGFPVFYVTDLLQLAEAMVNLGYGNDK